MIENEFGDCVACTVGHVPGCLDVRCQHYTHPNCDVHLRLNLTPFGKLLLFFVLITVVNGEAVLSCVALDGIICLINKQRGCCITQCCRTAILFHSIQTP